MQSYYVGLDVHSRESVFVVENEAGAIVARLSERNIIADHRGDRLRIGFGIYHTRDDALRLAAALH